MNSASHAFTAIAREEIEAKVRVYAQNPSFSEAQKRLEDHNVLIISGPPGVGKTTLAEMMSYAYIGAGWELLAIRSLDDGLSSIVDSKNQIFYFDDFLGKVALDTRALANRDSDLVRFMARVRNSKNARFIMTTRAYTIDALEQMYDVIDEGRDYLAPDVVNAAVAAVTRAITDIGDYIDHEDSESTLEDHAKSLSKLAPRIGIPASDLESATKTIESRIAQINEEEPSSDTPSFFSGRREKETFSDEDIRNLFAPLLAK